MDSQGFVWTFCSNSWIYHGKEGFFIPYGTLGDELGGHADQLIGLLEARTDKRLSLHYLETTGDHQAAFPLAGVKSITGLPGLLDK